ncbi:MAG: FimV/HubP family polar landmark protein, partial [Gammaproteobacteria bacterium]
QDMSDELDAEDEEDLDFLSDTDEAATKLDLARAYFEMGDKAGAREILEEVVKEGNEEQVKDARELLDKL